MSQFVPGSESDTAEHRRLREERSRQKNWKRWGPYLAERQWATVREDYSPDGAVWDYFPHDHARSRSYRWGEDGLLGFTDRECRLCFCVTLWNGKDHILKERLFGLGGDEGSHGEDVKERYYYLDSTPTHSYAKASYLYPQAEFPYGKIQEENAKRTREQPEYEIEDTGVFDDNRYFDVVAEYAKAGPNDICIRITATNRGPEAAPLHVLPTLWFRNTWVWGCEHEGCTIRPDMRADGKRAVRTDHESLGKFTWAVGDDADGNTPELLFTENHTNHERLFNGYNLGPYSKDGFHDRVVHGEGKAVNPKRYGTRAAAWYEMTLKPGESRSIHLRLFPTDEPPTGYSSGGSSLGDDFFDVLENRRKEADEFYDVIVPDEVLEDDRAVMRQAYAGLLWSKQFYHYIIDVWLEGDPDMNAPPERRKAGRNSDWHHLFSRDILSMPDKWEYPWFAAWDTAFHMIPFSRIDPDFAKDQLELFLREWYMHPNGQVPAYEFAFGDVNPPVHAWAVWRVYKMTAKKGERDRRFLASCFQKLLLNFTWWVNRKDPQGRHLFAGGFLGLDNIGVFDRNTKLKDGSHLVQADGTAWMAFYANTMLAMALELADSDLPEAKAYADMASKFFEHFVAIADAINGLGGEGLWDEQDGMYYDQLKSSDDSKLIRVRSLVGLLPLIAAEVFDKGQISRSPGFEKRMRWFLNNRPDLAERIAFMTDEPHETEHDGLLLALPSRERLERVLRYLLDEGEFLSPHGIRSVSKHHDEHPYTFTLDGNPMTVKYTPGESTTQMFGGNSNWRGPVWFPINYLLVEALQRYHRYYGEDFTVECPVGSGRHMTLAEVAREIERRLATLCRPDDQGRVLFHEYFHGDDGRGCGASHQTGWTSLVARCIEDLALHQDE